MNVNLFCWIKKCLRHTTNRIQIKNHRIGIYEITKISLPFFDGKIYFIDNGIDALALGY